MGLFIGIILFLAIGVAVLVMLVKTFAHMVSGGPVVDSVPASALSISLISPYAVLFVDGALLVLRDKKGQDKTIPISSIQDVKFKPATKLSNGTLVLSIPKSPTGAIGVGGATVMVGNEDETFIFTGDKLEAARQIYAHIQSVMASKGAPAAATGFADELVKLKALLDNGTITQEDFDAAKKKLLV